MLEFSEENQKKYAEADAKFKESPLLKKLLEQTRLNKEKYVFPSLTIHSLVGRVAIKRTGRQKSELSFL